MPVRNVLFSTPKQLKPSGLIPKHKQPFFLTLFPNLTFFQAMKTQRFIRILELNQTKSAHRRTDGRTDGRTNLIEMRALPLGKWERIFYLLYVVQGSRPYYLLPRTKNL